MSLNADSVPNTRHANFVESLTPAAAGREAFGNSLMAGGQLRELLTTLGTNPPFNLIPFPGEDNTTLVNGGIGTAPLVTQNAPSLSAGELANDRGESWGFCSGSF